MSRESGNDYKNGILINGFDYDKQVWVVDGRYVRCGHPDTMQCDCYGRKHEGETVAQVVVPRGWAHIEGGSEVQS